MNNNKSISIEEIEKEENLSTQTLNTIKYTSNKYTEGFKRPPANFIDLMDWTLTCFKPALFDQINLEKFIHNRISIDGKFLQYCQENKLTIECLYKDSIISWDTDYNYENFISQGVFLIRGKNLEFLQASLFHKGINNEDEVSIFIICSHKNYNSYIKLRNDFDKWSLKRERSNLQITVLDGDDISYSKENSWNDLFLPDNLKIQIKSQVENFLSGEAFYKQNNLAWKKGLLFYGAQGNGKSSIIKTIISEYDFKPITITASANDEVLRDAFSYAEEQSPALLFFEDLDSMLKDNVNLSTFLNLMDGISTKNGLLIVATANNIKDLTPSVKDRPSRFDRKFEIPLPTQEMADIYLKRWFGSMITVKRCKELAKYSAQNHFSYAYLKELYLSTMFEALSHNRKIPNDKDIQNSLNCLIKDKNLLGNNNSINMDKYFK